MQNNINKQLVFVTTNTTTTVPAVTIILEVLADVSASIEDDDIALVSIWCKRCQQHDVETNDDDGNEDEKSLNSLGVSMMRIFVCQKMLRFT